jgi:hypothetical protein
MSMYLLLVHIIHYDNDPVASKAAFSPNDFIWKYGFEIEYYNVLSPTSMYINYEGIFKPFWKTLHSMGPPLTTYQSRSTSPNIYSWFDILKQGVQLSASSKVGEDQ